ncbi:putative aromatic ring-opening dioxygenase LigB subunit [Lobosporangium transversale]|uniref:Putative aromatic ring-opening dioxygenase LigB subunit n=1 Tax=Lobosporangium transversale TaxID=64571 RepID=A0A1Y2GB23_9FUNG|nr:putative aromatic ring-opening dioxygenase LigB subunit [Lobosporangium transversale]ORZ05864.1 putative aromatic ring-opening dioxygenase LigB subunit [Lobosporangium transversale]|eukprot:XP_021877245.1 putative aromatic ring-opening dioxygenase LigB subunit [Lobosporangium transversale]
MTTSKLPVYFISHAGPNQAVDESVTADFFAELGKKWLSFSEPAPSSILVISGHWEGEEGVIRVRTSEENQLYYDFYNFPEFMYKLQYPSKGSPKLANRVLEILGKAGIKAEAETERGIDHGVWVPLLRILPKPEIPIVQMSLAYMRGQPAEKAFAFHYKLGQALTQLREENVLIVASGTAVHNLRDLGLYMRSGKVAPYVAPFDALLDKVALTEPKEAREKAAVEEMAKSPHLYSAHPSLDHLLPFHVALGAAGEDKGKVLHKNFILSLSESAYSFGEN